MYDLSSMYCKCCDHCSVYMSQKTKHSEFLTADDGAEGLVRVGHKSFYLLHSTRDTGQEFNARPCHRNVIFNTNL